MMNWMQQRLVEWEWFDPTHVSPILFKEFREKFAQFQRLLDEKVSIDRVTAKMFEYTIRKKVNWNILGKFKVLPLAEDMLLPAVEVQAGSMAPWLHIPSVSKWSVDAQFAMADEDDILPKETIVIKKDVISFIKDCIRTGNKFLAKPAPLLQVSEIDHFLVDIAAAQIKEEEIKDFRDVPQKIIIQKESDQNWISEELTQPEEPEPFNDNSTMETNQKMPKDWFELDIVFKDYVEQEKFTINYPVWFVADVMDPSYFHYLETHIRTEDLTKGVEYIVDAPFMTTRPVFKEPMSSFEYVRLYLHEKYLVDAIGKVELRNAIPAFREEYVLEETIEGEHYAGESESTIQLIPFYFADGDASCLKGSVAAAKLQQKDLEAVEVTADDQSFRSTKLEISNEGGFRVTAAMDDTTVSVRNDSLDATRMPTFIDLSIQKTSSHDITEPTDIQITHLSTKRSIDHDLDALITKRKSRRTNRKEGDNSALPVLSLLKENELKDCHRPKSSPMRGPPSTPPLPEDDPASQIAIVKHIEDPSPELYQLKKTIVMNSSNLSENQHLLKYFEKHFSIDIIELDIGFAYPDFLVSSDYGIFLVGSSSIEQADVDGNLCVQDEIIQMKSMVHELEAIIMVSQQSFLRREALLNFQLMLSLMGIKSLVIDQSDTLGICEKICLSAAAYGELLTVDDIKVVESLESSFLLDCGMNPFSSLKSLKQCSILDFMLMEASERSKTIQLPHKVPELIEELFNLPWSFH